MLMLCKAQKPVLCTDLVGGSNEAAYAWDRLIGEALNPTPMARSYSCENGHLLAAPESAGGPQQRSSQAGEPQLAEPLDEGRQPSSEAPPHDSPDSGHVPGDVSPIKPVGSSGAMGGRAAAADVSAAAADAAEADGRNDTTQQPVAPQHAAPSDAFVQVVADG